MKKGQKMLIKRVQLECQEVKYTLNPSLIEFIKEYINLTEINNLIKRGYFSLDEDINYY